MSTKTTSTNQIGFNPTSMGTYSGLQNPIQSTLSTWMGSPASNSLLQGQIGQGSSFINTQNAAQKQSLLSNAKSSGGNMAKMQPALTSMGSTLGRATSGAQANNWLSQMLTANQRQLTTTGMAQAYNPLMTGSTGTQTQSGLGTWLPSVISAGLGAGTGIAKMFAGGG